MRTALKSLGIFFAFLLVVFTIACSGGGGNPPPPPPPATYSVSGTITGATGVTVNLTGTTTATTTANGSYSFAGLANGSSCTITPTLSGYIFTPASVTFTVNGADKTNVNFTAAPATRYSISGNVSGGVSAGVKVSVVPGYVSATTDASGNYVLPGLLPGQYTVTPSLGTTVFTPASTVVSITTMDVALVNFTTPMPALTNGKLLYCGGYTLTPIYFPGLYSVDLSTGVETQVAGFVTGTVPDLIVPLRGATKKAAFRITGSHWPSDGIFTLNLVDGTKTYDVPASATGEIAPGYPSTTLGSFDVGSEPVNGNFSACTLRSTSGKKDIFLVLMNGSWFHSQITTDGVNSSPIIGGVDAAGWVSVYFIKNSTEAWKQMVNVLTDGTQPATLFTTNVMDSTRPMSVNAAYTHVAVMKNETSVAHIVVMPLAGGAEVDLGPGMDPYWDLSGSNKILYHDSLNTLWAINPDGTNKLHVPTPSKMTPGTIASVVFAPAGY